MKKTIIGLDPGYDRTGWAVAEVEGIKLTLLAYDCIQTSKGDALHQRYLQLDEKMHELLNHYPVTEAAIETLFFSKNKTTALKVAEARGFLLSALVRHNVTIYEYNPMQVKLTVAGYGKADKAAVIKMVQLQLGVQEGKAKILDDTYDAMALALTHSLLHRQLKIKV